MFHFARSSGWGLPFFISRSLIHQHWPAHSEWVSSLLLFRFLSSLFPEHRISMTDGRENKIRRLQEILHLHVSRDLES
jgi:hypothetical protein